ncbi:MAG TPA: adenosylcobinamide-GDP ribazoletransferase, partial [Coriobacteriia bacterium]
RAPAFPKPDAPARPLTDFASAVGFLTLLPIGRTWPEGKPPRSVGWYGWVGWILGLVAFVPLTLLRGRVDLVPMPNALLAGVLVVTVWALLTRFLHWDGLADSFDGLWGGHTPERRLEIMRDSHIGAFGVIAIVLVALVQVACVTLLVSRGEFWPLLAVPVAARFSLSLAAWELPAARSDGLGRIATGRAGVYERLVAGAALFALLAVMSLGASSHQFVFVVGAGVIAGMVVPRMLSKPVGGMTGDLFGATVLLIETIVLLTAVVIL